MQLSEKQELVRLLGLYQSELLRGGRQRGFMRWPAYEKMYISAFERMLDVRKAKGLPCDWQTGMDVFRWWMEDDNVSGQLSMDDLMEDNNV